MPFGLARKTDAAYVNGLDVTSGYAFYRRRTTVPRWPPDRLEVAGIPFADGSGALALMPASTSADLGVGTTRKLLTRASLAAVAGDLHRDATAAKTGPFSFPAFDDGALVVRWRPPAAPGPAPAGAVTKGVLEDMLADHLLSTHATGGDGEAARDLLRSPVSGMVRFERYRHLTLTGTALGVGPPSAAGAIVILSRPVGPVPPPGLPPAQHSALVVLENIDRASARECLGRLIWSSVIRRGDIAGVAALRGDTRRLHAVLVQAYLDYAHVARATHRPALADPLTLVAPALRAPFETAAPTPSSSAVEAVLAGCIAEAALRAALIDFVTTVVAEIVTGATWAAIGVGEVEGAPAAAPLLAAQKRLKLLKARPDTFVPCYAGAPVGRAAAVVVPAGRVPATSIAAQESLTLFHQEALLAAGRALPATDDYGTLAALRVIDDAGRDALLTTRDLLDAIVKGSNATAPWPAPVDIQPLADLGHPYADAVDWLRAVAAVEARTQLDSLRASSPSVERATIAFWKSRTGLVTVAAGVDQWPVILPGVGAAERPPSPSAPYLQSQTRAPPAVSGFDEHDLEAVFRARSVVRDARSLSPDIPIPLFLALLERESYRSDADDARRARRHNFATGLPGAATAEQLRNLSIQDWLFFPFGLDLLVRGTPLSVSPTGHPLRPSSPAQFGASFGSLHGHLVSSGLLAADLEPLLDELDCLAFLGVRRPGERNGATGISLLMRSRSAQWMGIALQMATFQFVHQQLVGATLARHAVPATNAAYVRVEELTAMPAPRPDPVAGTDANSPERRAFIAYWSLVYLAFNVQPATWNAWVNSVPDAKLAAGIPAVSQYLTDHANADPTLVDTPPGAGPRRIGQRGHQVRFAASLDAYLRLGVDADLADTTSPAARAWPGP